MARTMAIFDWIFSLGKENYDLFYLQSKDAGLSSEALEARKSKENESIATIQGFARKYRSLGQVWSFLNTKHDLHTAKKLVEREVWSSIKNSRISKKVIWSTIILRSPVVQAINGVFIFQKKLLGVEPYECAIKRARCFQGLTEADILFHLQSLLARNEYWHLQ
jgi:hypothetical protein